MANEMLFGYLPPDNPEGRWFRSTDKTKYVRFYDTGFREVVHYREDITVMNEWGMGEPTSGWVISIGYHDEFQVGWTFYPTSRAAMIATESRSFEDECNLEDVVSSLKDAHNRKQPSIPDSELY